MGALDQALFHLINEQWTHPVLDLFMAAISDVEIWKPLLIILVLYALIFGGFKGRALVFCIGLCLLVNSSLTSSLKKLVDRRRPKHVERVRMVEMAKARPEFLTLFKPVKIRYSGERDRDRSGPSFPSGHVTTNTTIALFDPSGTLVSQVNGSLAASSTLWCPAPAPQTSIHFAAISGGGMVCPSCRRPSRWNGVPSARAARSEAMLLPAATQSGQSGTQP